ncbi:OST-HTH/LOTUS domain-containing protein [Aliikangiella sp. IMCC44653]
MPQQKKELARQALGAERDEIYQKIGRNVILYQQLEQLLKHIVVNSGLSAPISQIKKLQDANRKKANTTTMGILVGRYVKSIDPNSPDDEPSEAEVTEAMLSYRFHVEMDESCYESKKEALSRIVEGRNKLIHHITSEYNFQSKVSLKTLSKELESQAEEIRKEVNELKVISKAMIQTQKEYVSYLSTEEFLAYFELDWLRTSRIVTTLTDILDQLADESGAVSLTVAGQLLDKHVPEEKAAMKERFGYSSLKQLILATGLFEVVEEPTNKGGWKVLYKLKTDLLK